MSSAGVEPEEVEANHLGANLLMLRTLLREEMRNQEPDPDDGETIELLAKRFQSEQFGHLESPDESKIVYLKIKENSQVCVLTLFLISRPIWIRRGHAFACLLRTPRIWFSWDSFRPGMADVPKFPFSQCSRFRAPYGRGGRLRKGSSLRFDRWRGAFLVPRQPAAIWTVGHIEN